MDYKKLLEAWGMSNYIEAFEDDGIDDESFPILDSETIAKLFPKSGPRLIFKKKYNEMFPTPATSKSFEVESSDLYNCSTPASVSTYTTNESIITDLDVSFVPDQELLDVIENIGNKVSEKRKIDDPLDNTPSCSKKQQTGLGDIDSVFPEGLERVLQKYTDGKLVLLNRNKLTNDLRQKLVKVAVNELFANKGSDIRGSTFMRIAEEITILFPNEKSETYYIPYIVTEKKKRGVGPKGKLWSRYTNVRTALRNANAFKENENPNKPSEQSQSPNKELQLEFLKTATEPYLKILANWQETYSLRRKLYLNSNLETIFTDFPCLRLSSGIELIETDFNQKFPDKIDIIYTTWPKVMNAINKEAAERNISIAEVADPSLKALITLPFLFQPVTLKKNRKGVSWRPTRVEVQESFFMRISNFDELQEKRSSRRQKLSTYGISDQPYACVAGNLEAVNNFYIVVVNDVVYKVDSSIRALELLFKLYHALDVEYPAESEHIWLFIQEIVFNIKSRSTYIWQN
ncbi:uncharacterized protein LOC116176215 isoform X3 [Photinus pyralis]|nr:uncharacterized protein LOC116176215 isoform X3 [Photinus pyralis]